MASFSYTFLLFNLEVIWDRKVTTKVMKNSKNELDNRVLLKYYNRLGEQLQEVLREGKKEKTKTKIRKITAEQRSV